jgi:outer membrane protein OmpA-like peptidoglycan-associated protein/tetratricopeptide (TPR) repeat protein
MRKIFRQIPLFLLLVFAATLSAQTTQADKLFQRGAYYDAIPLYKREAKSKNATKRLKALVKLGDSYKAINNFPEAENAYNSAYEVSGELPSDAYLRYAQVLKVNNHYEEASEQYKNYLKLNPNDETIKRALTFCQNIKDYMNKPSEYEVTNVGLVNTQKSEFSPYVVSDKLLFIAERAQFDFVGFEKNECNGEPFLNLYVSPITNSDVKKEKPFSKSINSQFHDGPGCVSTDGATLYFTRVTYMNKRNYVNQSKIYTAVGSMKGWKKVKPLDLNSDDYSIAHPSISSDNSTLFFTSNMPGGFGGKDIWMCKREGDTWGTPVNLGPDINTTGDEMFPSIRKDGTLFFSSDGLPGFGALDVYSAKELQGKWVIERNEGQGMNSSADDFGITFLNDSMGYFSSNRAGGKGGDDIYKFVYRSRGSTSVSGTVLLTENLMDKARGKKVLLLDEKGNVVDSTLTDQNGFFSFRNLPPDQKYMTSIEEADPGLVNKARFYLATDTTIHRVTAKYQGNRFVFKNLPVDPNSLPELYTKDDLVFAGSLTHDGKQPLKNVKLKLVNEYGDVMEETTTNENGSFAFRNIPSDQNYVVSIEEGDIQLPEGTKVSLNNKVGKEIRSFYKTKEKFNFKILASEKAVMEDMDAEDMNLYMGLYGYMYDEERRPLSNIKIKVHQEDGSDEQDWVTSEAGKFSFRNLAADKNYIFEADENDANLKGVKKIFIADAKGRVYKIVELGKNGKFEFKILETDKASLGEFVVNDPWLKVVELKKENVKPSKELKPVEVEEEGESELSITIVENIYYPYGIWEIDENAKIVLDKAVDAMKDYPKLVMEISSHTDSQSSSEFNMGLSNRRAQTCVDYVVSKGIDRKRLKSKGYGESKLLNRCGDGVECTDEEHRVNRRTEFKITKPTK